MNTINTSSTQQPGQMPGAVPTTSSNSKPLWAAVGALGVAVLAMGGTMLYQGRSPTPVAVAAPSTTPSNLKTPSALVAQAGNDDLIEKPVTPAPKPVVTPAPVRKAVTTTPKPAPLTYSRSDGSPAYPQQQVCHSCGTVESVTPVQRSTKTEGPGVGAVAGGVLGAVLGNQVGHGGGRAAATLLGAVGGGFAGNAIEGNMKKVTVYQVGVRMEDGSRRSVEISQAPNVGSQVTVEGSNLRYR